jgi:hypothetical protein
MLNNCLSNREPCLKANKSNIIYEFSYIKFESLCVCHDCLCWGRFHKQLNKYFSHLNMKMVSNPSNCGLRPEFECYCPMMAWHLCTKGRKLLDILINTYHPIKIDWRWTSLKTVQEATRKVFPWTLLDYTLKFSNYQ